MSNARFTKICQGCKGLGCPDCWETGRQGGMLGRVTMLGQNPLGRISKSKVTGGLTVELLEPCKAYSTGTIVVVRPTDWTPESSLKKA